MNLFTLPPNQLISTDSLDNDFVSQYQLSLPSYTVSQLIMMMHQNEPSQMTSDYLDRLYLKKEENDDFRHGVIDAFCEIVRAGVKRIAFSHATSDIDTFRRDFHHAYACAKKYGIQYYIEENLIETRLFHNSGHLVIIFYSNQKDIEAYLQLKKEILETKNPSLSLQKEFARRLGYLLSYSNQRIEEMIEAY